MEGRASDWKPGPTVCRCCLTEGCYKDISTEYFWMGKREVYAEMLSETLNVSIAYSKSGGPNSNSRLICEPCIARLRDASEFKRQVFDCEKIFMNHLDPGSSSKPREFSVGSVSEVKVEVVKHEKESLGDDDFDDRPDFLDVDTDDDLDDQPLTKLASKVPKKESVDLLELLDSTQITVKRKSNVKVKQAPPPKKKKKEITVKSAKPSASKVDATKTIEKKKDDVWTSTNSDVLSDEWITTDYRNATHDIERECSWGEISVSLQEQSLDDDEWIVSDMTHKPITFLRVDSKSFEYAGEEVQSRPEWTTTIIKKSPKKLAPRNNLSRMQGISRQRTKILTSTPTPTPLTNRRSPPDKKLKSSVPKESKRLKKKFLNNAHLILKHTTAIPYRVANASSNIPCFACKTKFTDPFSFREHFRAEHADVDKTKGMHIYNTVQTRVDITDLACLLCLQPFDSVEEIAQHLVQQHNIEIELEERLGVVPLKFPHKGLYLCAVCQKKCHTFRDLYRHSGCHFHFHVCEICGKSYESTSGLKEHLNQTHVDGHRCKICKAVFPTTDELRRHVRENFRCASFKCRPCKIPFSYSELLHKHREVVHGAQKRIYNCSECPKVFERRVQVYLHFKKAHTDDYKCSYCDKKFGTSKCLKVHTLVHTGERPYKCHFCPRAFRKPHFLRAHIANTH